MDITAGPYRGPHYYRIQDRGLFHGRRGDIEPLLAVVLGNQVAALHAPSGAGKSSLLRAALVPAMEARRQTVVMCHPGDQPVQAVRAAVVNALLPSPTAELVTLSRLRRHFAPDGDGRRLSLVDAKQRYRSLQPHSHAYRKLVDDIRLPTRSPLLVRGAPPATMPSTARFLYLQKGADVLVGHLARIELAIGRIDGVWTRAAEMRRGAELHDFLERTSVAELTAFFKNRHLREWHADTVLTLSGSEATLAELFAHLMRQMSSRHAPLEVTLVIDQFEELFTRFGESAEVTRHSATRLLDYELRVELFRQIGELAQMRRPGLDGVPRKLPVRVLVSLRDDYIARLDELEAHIGMLEARARYHLTVLRPEVADEVIRAPARAFGYDYEDDVFALIRDKLTEEGDKIAPGHVQIVCERLWRGFGRAMFEARIAALGGESGTSVDLAQEVDKPRVTMTQLEGLKGIGGILDSHFQEFLAGFEDGRDRIDILDMLAPLITSRHTRNIVMREVVVGRRFVDEGIRTELLDQLRRQNIVRIETHRNGDYVEISHEFLIEPIEQETARVKQADERWAALQRAFERLEVVERAGFRSATAALDADEMRALYWFRDRLDPVELRAWVAELLLRVCISDLSDADARRGTMLQYWQGWVDESPAVLDARTLLAALRGRSAERRWLDHVELAVLANALAGADLDYAQEVFLLGSVIRNGGVQLAAGVAAGLARG